MTDNRNPMKTVEVADFLLQDHAIRVLEDRIKLLEDKVNRLVEIINK